MLLACIAQGQASSPQIRFKLDAPATGYSVPAPLERKPSFRAARIAAVARGCDGRVMWAGYLAVFVGGGIGAALRHAVNRAALAGLGPGFPYGTLIVNVAGGLLMGMAAELFLVKGGGSQELRLFLITGVLGGFTTFSAFSLEAALMWQRGDHAALASYVASSVVLSIAALFLGMAAVRSLA